MNLREFIAKPRFEYAALDLSYTQHLTALDGIQPDISENVREMGFEPADEAQPVVDPVVRVTGEQEEGGHEDQRELAAQRQRKLEQQQKLQY